jgi:DNA-binding MarR family transcriptional regulator
MPDRIERPSLLLQVFALDQRAGTLLRTALAGAPLRPDEFAVYSVLRLLGTTTPTVLGRAVGMPPTTLSTYLRRMTEAKHVRRRRNPADGRSALVTLTASGTRVTERCFPGFAAARDALTAELGVTYDDASAVLSEVAEAMDRATARLAVDEPG